MGINQFTQPRKAWIVVDERYPDYSVKFTHDPEVSDGSIQVEFTPQQAKFVRRFQKMQEQYTELCKGLVKP